MNNHVSNQDSAFGRSGASHTFMVDVSGRTDRGLVRELNEDSFLADTDIRLFIIADGMGGHSAGEVASKMAVEIIDGYMKYPKPSTKPLRPLYYLDYARKLIAAVQSANEEIFYTSHGKANLKGMGTTVTAALALGNKLLIAHVGDSRAYLIRGKTIEQITDDHTLIAEQLRKGIISEEDARTSNMHHVLIRALGTSQHVKVDYNEVVLMNGDRVIMCSDGLTRMVEDNEIIHIVKTFGHPEKACDKLIEIANNRGGEDNITVIGLYFKISRNGILNRFFNFLRFLPRRIP